VQGQEVVVAEKLGALSMTVRTTVFLLAALLLTTIPVCANQAAVIPAYSLVSAFQSSMEAYQSFITSQNRAAARKLLNSEKVFLSPRDVRVEVVTVDESIAKVKLRRLDDNAQPVTLYFWTLAEQLKMLPHD
jgi:hypothetical protein